MMRTLLVCAAALMTSVVMAQSDSMVDASPVLTKADADSWLDGFVPYALQTGDIAGAVVVIVKDGQVLTQRGFGYADVAARKPMDPAHTLIRPGSVSKLFTWTAIMQLVEQGKVDLDADVNTYLDFEIPKRDGQPLTLRNILTHTPGFEEQIKGIMNVESDGQLSLEQNIKRWTPARIFAPGTVPAYSNYATALAGYVVQRVSGLPYDDYVEQHLLQPLSMTNSTFRQPLPERFRPFISKGYASAFAPERPFEIVGPAPAGSLSATAADMARFMIAHLQQGQLDGRQILAPETAKLMHETTLEILPRVNRMALGFYQTDYKGRRVIAHGGDTQWFHSDLRLFLDDGVGYFLSLNSRGHGSATMDIRTAFAEQFADRYLTGRISNDLPKSTVDAKTVAEHARLVAGRYSMSRRFDSNFFSLMGLMGGIDVIDNRDGSIGVSMIASPSGVPAKWFEVEPLVWRQEHAAHSMSARLVDGKVALLGFEELSPIIVLQPTPLKSGGLAVAALALSLIATLLTTIAWPVSGLLRRHYRISYPLAGVEAKAHRWVRVAAAATVTLWLVWLFLVVGMMADLGLSTGKLDLWLATLQALSLLIFAGGAGMGLWYAWVTLRGARRWHEKTWSVVLALALLVSLCLALAHHLIAFDVNY